ncbi:O-antigen ligase family protein [Caldicoprobacter faecalis]|uniref:O-antigen ligase n=1 Tax=Caldicoprobacter faecalis TaxID=937334 RepID=A0A1I5Y6P0_9FIRM|nr:O-antigen ligase family protein [Caldicoprobacter faecalis]SFQ39895.1 O-antigen ligase [Caldicoprobacter faecalis]
MENIINALLITNVFYHVFVGIKRKFITGLVIISTMLSIILTAVGIDSNKLLVCYTLIYISLLLFLSYNGTLFVRKLNLLGLGLISIFFIFFSLSYLFSPAALSDYGLWKIKQFTITAIFPSLLILLGKIGSKEVRWIENFILISAFFISLIVIINFIISGSNVLSSNWFIRHTAGDINPIWLSRFLGVALIIIQSPRFSHKFFWVCIISIFFLCAGLLSGSKIILYFVIPIAIFYRIRSHNNKDLIKFMLFILVLIIVIYCFFSIFDPLAITRRFSLKSGTAIQRITLYKLSFDAYKSGNFKSIVVGNGVGTIGQSLGFGYVREYPHNIIIEILYELGFIGLSLFLLQLFTIIKIYLNKTKSWIFYTYILFFLCSLTSGDLVSNENIFIYFAFNIMYVNSDISKQLSEQLV